MERSEAEPRASHQIHESFGGHRFINVVGQLNLGRRILGGMTQHWFRLYVQRIDTTKNMARFYAMSIEPDIFGGSALVRRWGRIGTRGQERIDSFTDDLQAISHFAFLARQKRARGYMPQPLS